MEHRYDICQVRSIQHPLWAYTLNDISRPLVTTGICILILYLLYFHYFDNSQDSLGENSPTNHHKNVEHILMKESDLEEMDETEHLYLEQ